jgi:hypothetical protein
LIFPFRLLRPFCPRVVLASILTCCALEMILSCERSFGQATTSLLQSADTKNVDSIDLSTLNVTLNIPVFHKPGRGLDAGLSLTHTNAIWGRNLFNFSNSTNWQTPLAGYGWNPQLNNVGTLFYTLNVTGCGDGRSVQVEYDDFVYIGPDGISHYFSTNARITTSRNMSAALCLLEVSLAARQGCQQRPTATPSTRFPQATAPFPSRHLQEAYSTLRPSLKEHLGVQLPVLRRTVMAIPSASPYPTRLLRGRQHRQL